DRLNYGTWTTSPVTFDITAKTSSGIGGVWSGVTSVTGNAANTTANAIVGGGAITLDAAIADKGGNGTQSWTNFGTLSGTSVNFNTGGSVTGDLTAATLNYGTWTTSPVTVDITAKTSSGIGGVSSVTGNAANTTANAIVGGGAITLDAAIADTGGNGPQSWTNFGTLSGT